MKPISITETVLRRQRRRARGTLLVWAAAAAIFAQSWNGAVRLGWIAGSVWWALGPAAVAVYLLIRWSRRVWRLDDRAIARECDAHWGLQARLESSVELSDGDSAMAAAQRAETVQSLESKKPIGTLAWFGGIAALLIGLGVGGTETAIWVSRTWSRYLLSAPASTIARAPDRSPEPMRASITWKSPARTIKAKAYDEIPLTARAESNYGFRSISLEVLVNGIHVSSRPLAPGVIGILTQPGGNDLKLSLFLDETGAKPPDIVSYYLQAEAAFPPAFPAVVSPRQIVEVIPGEPAPAADAAKEHREEGLTARDLTPAGRLEQLARRQTEANRKLESTAPDSVDLPAAADEQASIVRDAEKLAAEHGLIEPAQKLLDAAVKAATEAARQLGLADLQAAREPAAEAQAAFQRAVEIQESEGRKTAAALLKQVRKKLNDAGRLNDPIAQSAQKERVRRELNAEAERQQQRGSAEAAQKLVALSGQLGDAKKSPPPGPEENESESAQSRKGSKEKAPPPPPGDESSQGNENASAQSQKKGPGGQPGPGSSGDQGRRGDAGGLATLNHSSAKVSGSGFAPSTMMNAGGARGTPPLADAAAAAAETEASLVADDALAQTIRRLQAAASRLSESDDSGSGLSMLEMAAQEARSLTNDGRLATSAGDIAAGAGSNFHRTLDPSERKALVDRARQLAAELEKARPGAKRDEWVHRFAPEDVDPNYRKPVGEYFERLSREGGER